MKGKTITILIMMLLVTTSLSIVGLAKDDLEQNPEIQMANPNSNINSIDSLGGKGLGWNYLHTGTSHETVGIDDNSFCVSASYLPAELRLAMTIDLSADIGYDITKLAYHDTEGYPYTDATNCIAEVWTGDSTQPLTLVASETFVSNGDGWHDINLTDPVEITGTGIYWIVFGFYQTTADWFLFSLDDICTSPGCAWFSSDGGATWTDIPGAGYCFTMNYEVYVEEGGPQPQDVMISSVESGWNIISLPFNYTEPKTNVTVNYLGENYSWADAVSNGYVSDFVFGWNRDSQSYEFASEFAPGEAYWLYMYEPCELWMNNITIYLENIETIFSDGWNLMGLHTLDTVPNENLTVTYGGSDYTWNDAVSNGYISQFVFGWNRASQSYEFSYSLLPGFGYWMYSSVDCVVKYLI